MVIDAAENPLTKAPDAPLVVRTCERRASRGHIRRGLRIPPRHASGRTASASYAQVESPKQVEERLLQEVPAGGRLGANPDAVHSTFAYLTWRRGTTRAIGALRNCRRFSRVCPNYFGCAYKIGNLFRGFETCGGSKNRRLHQCNISISEVLISVTLSVCGEVAEWPKAAVC